VQQEQHGRGIRGAFNRFSNRMNKRQSARHLL
jgi:hypothetical protein